MTFQWRRHRVEPVGRAQIIFEIVIEQDFVDPELEDVQLGPDGELHLAQHLRRIIRVRGEDQHHRLALLNRAGDLAGKRAARLDIAGRDPTAESRVLQSRADGVRDGFVLAGVGNENVVRHTSRVAAVVFVARRTGNLQRVTWSGRLRPSAPMNSAVIDRRYSPED